MVCRGQKKCTRQNASLPSARKKHSAKTHFAECQKMALGKIHLCRVPEKRHSAKTRFAECKKMALGKIHLCRVPKKTLGKAVFAECPIKYTRQRFRHSAKCRFPVVWPPLKLDFQEHFMLPTIPKNTTISHQVLALSKKFIKVQISESENS